ncbi:class I adenylate-forming enzyme family protein [Streptomyces sp. NPDC087300]|uniref:class I adenylate-forming enzyme family protein n=1 Tax=Streptomyces sp. NPDC087300 TaxID=3365780 RepID=UPI0037FFBE51
MLADLFTEALREHKGRVALTDSFATVTYEALDGRSRVAEKALFPHGAPREGTRVGIKAANSVGYVTAYVALLRSGCVPFLIDASLGATELGMIVEDCGLDLLLHDDVPGPPELPGADTEAVGAVEGLRLTRVRGGGPRPELLPDTEVCRFTSGSTGRPSCIEFSARAVERAARNWTEGTGLTRSDGIACFAALSNGLAFNTSLLSAFLVGARLHLSQGLPTAGRVTRLLEKTGASRLVGFPALYESVVRRGSGDPGTAAAVRRLNLAISSAAPLRPEVRARFTELTGVPVSDYYGTAETGPLTFAAGTGPLTFAAGTGAGGSTGLGVPLPGVTLRAGESAERPVAITVRSESMGSRYLNAPGVFESRLDEAGFYRTGDTGYLGADGLVLTGRTNRMINVAGRKIDPVEVGAVLREVPGVRDAVVLEAADRRGDPVVAAVYVGDTGVTDAVLRGHVAARLAPYKAPALLRSVPRIPCGSTGKPSLTALRRLFENPEDPQ